jgi:predicted neuraminidase
MKIVNREFLNVETSSCHASTIAFYQEAPVFAWFGGDREGLPDSSIYIQYKDKVRVFGDKVQIAYWNPILFTIEDELFIAYKRGDFCDRWQTYILNISNINRVKNIDESKSQIIPAGLNFCVKTKPIITDNWLMCGSSVETKEDWTSYIEDFVYEDGKFIFTERSKPITVDKKKYIFEHPWYGKINRVTSGIIQPSIWKDKRGICHAFFRSSRGLGRIYYSHKDVSSCPDGEWSKPEETQFENPNSGVDTLYMDGYMDGRLFMVYNPSEVDRFPLVIRELNDKFDTLDEIVIRESIDKDDRTNTNELSYPYLIGHNDRLHLTYTYGRKKIEYIIIEA